MNNQLQANPNYVIEELSSQNAQLTQENAMLRAIIREYQEQQNNEQTSRRRVTFSTLLYKILGGNYHGKRNCKNTESYILVQVNEKGEEGFR